MKLHEVQKKRADVMHLPEAAVFMQMSYMQLYRLVKGGKIKPLNIAITGDKPIYGFTPDIIQAYYDSLPNPAPLLSQTREGDAVAKGIN